LKLWVPSEMLTNGMESRFVFDILREWNNEHAKLNVDKQEWRVWKVALATLKLMQYLVGGGRSSGAIGEDNVNWT